MDYIISVDIFFEGVDVPEINQVIMLRPTESPIVFIQQLGRGLRKAENKEYVVVLDFIGNYRNNFMIPIALYGDRSYNSDTIRKYMISGNNIIPGSSTIHFDEISKERIFHSIDKIRGIRAIIRENYMMLKNRLGRIPYLLDFYENGEIDHLFLNFSDPWPKKRHAKRRLTSSAFLNVYRRLLKKDGVIEFKTDNRGLFEYSLQSVTENNYHLDYVSLDLHNSPEAGDNIMTEYERKFSVNGPIYKMIISDCKE